MARAACNQASSSATGSPAPTFRLALVSRHLPTRPLACSPSHRLLCGARLRAGQREPWRAERGWSRREGGRLGEADKASTGDRSLIWALAYCCYVERPCDEQTHHLVVVLYPSFIVTPPPPHSPPTVVSCCPCPEGSWFRAVPVGPTHWLRHWVSESRIDLESCTIRFHEGLPLPFLVVHHCPSSHRPRSLARSLPLPSHISRFWAVIGYHHAAPEASVASALQPDPARAPHEASRALWSSLDGSRTSDTGHSPAPFSPPKLQRATCSSWVTSPPDTPSNSHVDSPAARPDCLVRRAQSQSETQDQLNFSATRTRPRHRALLCLLSSLPVHHCRLEDDSNSNNKDRSNNNDNDYSYYTNNPSAPHRHRARRQRPTDATHPPPWSRRRSSMTS